MNILEEFRYGNIEPAEYDPSSGKEYKEHHSFFDYYVCGRCLFWLFTVDGCFCCSALRYRCNLHDSNYLVYFVFHDSDDFSCCGKGSKMLLATIGQGKQCNNRQEGASTGIPKIGIRMYN